MCYHDEPSADEVECLALIRRKAARANRLFYKNRINGELFSAVMEQRDNPAVPTELYEGLLDAVLEHWNDLQTEMDDIDRWLDTYSCV